jgi:MinD superfamily P-loop ATPase
MRVVVASGKGGTGKTLVATSLALVASACAHVALLDADVEAPNAAIFLKPQLTRPLTVERLVPRVDTDICRHCGRCAEVCQYHAIAALPSETLVFDALCHGCGSCVLVCPERAIREVPIATGLIETGRANGMVFAQGTLQLGEAMATPVIRELKRLSRREGWDVGGWVIVDAPPGSACPVIEALRGADVALLVTEPTPFGLHDLRLAVEVARHVLGLPVGVVINKDGPDYPDVYTYCADEKLPVLLRIPLRRDVAVAYSNGVPLVEAFPEYRPAFVGLVKALQRLATEAAR